VPGEGPRLALARKWAAVSIPQTTGTAAICSAETGSQLTYGWSEMVIALEIS
jgi:hypothetical protein